MSDKTAPTVDVVAQKEGWLTKKGRMLWKPRLFVLKENVLYYYRASSDIEPAFTMSMLTAVVTDATKKTGKKFAFEVADRDQSLAIFAENEVDYDEWMQALKKATSPLPNAGSRGKDNREGVVEVHMGLADGCDRCTTRIHTIVSNFPNVSWYDIDIHQQLLKLRGTFELPSVLVELYNAGFMPTVI